MQLNKIIGVIGSSSTNKHTNLLAEQVGKRLAENGFIVLCGGLGGVMEAVCRGAKSAGGTTIGILPGKSPKNANPYIDIPIATGIGEARNIIIVRSSCVLIAIAGGFGTLSEIAFALKLGVPIIGLKTWNLGKTNKEFINIVRVKTAKQAVNKALELINNK